MGFIVLPVLAMVYFFIELVLVDSSGSQRIRIPQEVIESQNLLDTKQK
jgi:hypothetical protein